jgi:hypothetical protein
MEIIVRESNAKSLIERIKADYRLSIKNKNKEMEMYLHELIRFNNKVCTIERVKIDTWKGKSGITFIEKPDKFIITHYQKKEKGSEPKEIKTELLKEEVNRVIIAINILNSKREKEIGGGSLTPKQIFNLRKIPTREIGETAYRKDWDKEIFSNRKLHIKLTFILNLLEIKGYIKYYRSGKTEVIRNLQYF